MSNRSKGLDRQKKAAQYYRDMGYITHNQTIGSKFQKNRDLFGLWDICAIKPIETLWIQVKSNTKPNTKPYEEWCYRYRQIGIVLIWKDYKGWREIRINENGEIVSDSKKYE